jgi:hypothetical protein
VTQSFCVLIFFAIKLPHTSYKHNIYI